MHRYFQAIGFKGPMAPKIIRIIIKNTVDEYLKKVNKADNENIAEIFANIDEDLGIVIHGEFADKDDFEVEYTYPFVKPKLFNYYDEINIERNVANSSFFGSIEENSLGISLIFYLQNPIDYIKNSKNSENISGYIGLSGMALSGKIVMPVIKDKKYDESNKNVKINRKKLIEDAKNGDEAAIETLTFDEMNVYSKLSARIISEDVLSIVDTSFMPYGIECDRYSIIGEILEVNTNINKLTGVRIFNLTIDCNDIIMNVIISADDLLGIPAPGRRFKGDIWLQGTIRFTEPE